MAPQELPRLSAFTRIFAMPEMQFENMFREMFNIELPPGPQSTLLKFQESIEGVGEEGGALKLPSIEKLLPLPIRTKTVEAQPELLPELTPAKREIETRPPKTKFELV